MTITSSSPEAIAAYKQGIDAEDNFRMADAKADYKKALAIDPTFPLARAHLGELNPGKDGLAMIQQAADASTTLPEAERIDIQAMLARAEGDFAKAYTLHARMAKLVPDDWHVQSTYGTAAMMANDLPTASKALTRASELEPSAGSVWNTLGYVRARSKDYDGAIAAFDKSIALAPSEANGWDSKAEVLLRAGRFDESIASFEKASQLDPSFWMALDGAAQAHFLKGDATGGFAALDKAESAAHAAPDVFTVRMHRAWARYALQGAKAAEPVLADVDAYTADHADTFHHAQVPLFRALMAILDGRPADALAVLPDAATRSAGLEGNEGVRMKIDVATLTLVAEAQSGQAAKAEDQLDTIDAIVSKNAGLADFDKMARGELAAGRGDAAGAVKTLSQCEDDSVIYAICVMLLAEAQDQAKDTKGATATRERLRTLNTRQSFYLGIWSKVGGPAHLQSVSAGDSRGHSGAGR